MKTLVQYKKAIIEPHSLSPLLVFNAYVPLIKMISLSRLQLLFFQTVMEPEMQIYMLIIMKQTFNTSDNLGY